MPHTYATAPFTVYVNTMCILALPTAMTSLEPVSSSKWKRQCVGDNQSKSMLALLAFATLTFFSRGTSRQEYDCSPDIVFLPMREQRTELDTSGPFVTVSYTDACYATDGAVLELQGCSATIHVSATDPSVGGHELLELESFELQSGVPSLLRVSGILLRDGPLYVWAERGRHVTAPRKIEMCRRAVPAIPSVSMRTEKQWLADDPGNIINTTKLIHKSDLLAAGIVSPAQARLLYWPVPLLASITASTQLSDSVTVTILYTIVEGSTPNIFDVCETPGRVTKVPGDGIQVDRASTFLCSQLRNGIWRLYNSSSVPSVLPPATLYMVASEKAKLLPSLVTYTTYPIDTQLEDAVAQKLKSSGSSIPSVTIAVFLLEVIALALAGFTAMMLLTQLCTTHDILHPGRASLPKMRDSMPLLNLTTRNVWLLRYNPRLDFTALADVPGWRPHVRVSPELWGSADAKFAKLSQTIPYPRNLSMHRRRLIIEYLVRRPDPSQEGIFYKSTSHTAGELAETLLRERHTVHEISMKCLGDTYECKKRPCWFVPEGDGGKCFCARHASVGATLIPVTSKKRSRCMFCDLAVGDRVCLRCAGGSLFCQSCENILHSNCTEKHRVLRLNT